jgi:hypothetical protein
MDSTVLALAVMLLGLGTVVWSIEHGIVAARRYQRDPLHALALLRSFRTVIIGLSVAGIAAAWCWQLDWLLGLSLIIGGEELLESTIVISALKRGAQHASAA